MKLHDYQKQFNANLKIMSRTANGNLDLSASATKADSMAVKDGDTAKQLVEKNTEQALNYLYQSRHIIFNNADEVSDFIIGLAEIVNNGIVKKGHVFREGADSDKYPYLRIKDIPAGWKWFCEQLFRFHATNETSFIEVCAFIEYVVNASGHFFSDSCGKISMLLSTFVCMIEDSSCPEYRSRDEYYSIIGKHDIPTPEHMIDEKCFRSFYRYYRDIFNDPKSFLVLPFKVEDPHNPTLMPDGPINDQTVDAFDSVINAFYVFAKGVTVHVDCNKIKYFTTAGTNVLKKLIDNNRRFRLFNVKRDCYVAMELEGLLEYVDNEISLPEYDTSKYPMIGEGANGKVYCIDESLVLKAFKRKINFDDILRERIITKNALIKGIPGPISLGLAKADGNIALLIEYVHATSLLKLIKNNPDKMEEYAKNYVNVVKQIHNIQGTDLSYFPRKSIVNRFLNKCDFVDQYLKEENKGKVRRIIESIDEPEVLLHGDIQPSNVMVSDEGYSFIDLETLSSGYAIIDVGALYRTLFYEIDFEESCHRYNKFLDLSEEECKNIWKYFIKYFYEGCEQKYIDDKIKLAQVIASIYGLAFRVKHNPGIDLKPCIDKVEKLIEEY